MNMVPLSEAMAVWYRHIIIIGVWWLQQLLPRLALPDNYYEACRAPVRDGTHSDLQQLTWVTTVIGSRLSMQADATRSSEILSAMDQICLMQHYLPKKNPEQLGMAGTHYDISRPLTGFLASTATSATAHALPALVATMAVHLEWICNNHMHISWKANMHKSKK